jgi:hypothetical protein
MVKTGERVRQPGSYSSACCSYETGLGVDEVAPPCGTCSRPAEWLPVTPGDPKVVHRG